MSEFTKQYHDFFKESQAGLHYVERLTDLIEAKHRQAENDMEHCRDHLQQAAGVREAIKLVGMLSVEAKKPM